MAGSLNDDLSAALHAMASGVQAPQHAPISVSEAEPVAPVQPAFEPERANHLSQHGERPNAHVTGTRRRPQVQPQVGAAEYHAPAYAPVAGPVQVNSAEAPPAYPPRNGHMSSQVQPTQQSAPRSNSGRHTSAIRRPSAAKPQGFRAVAAPVLGTVGGLLLIPAIWATLLLGGVDVPGSKRSDAASMAMFMLMCWPVAICLIAASVHFFIQVMKAKKKALEELRAKTAAAGAGSTAAAPTTPPRPAPRRR